MRVQAMKLVHKSLGKQSLNKKKVWTWYKRFHVWRTSPKYNLRAGQLSVRDRKTTSVQNILEDNRRRQFWKFKKSLKQELSRVSMALCARWFQDAFIHIQDMCVAAAIVANLRKNEFRNHLHYSWRRKLRRRRGPLTAPYVFIMIGY